MNSKNDRPGVQTIYQADEHYRHHRIILTDLHSERLTERVDDFRTPYLSLNVLLNVFNEFLFVQMLLNCVRTTFSFKQFKRN